MPPISHLRPSDLQGIAQLAIDATLGVTGIVEDLHRNVAKGAPPLGKSPEGRTRGLTGLVYRSIRGVTRLTGATLQAALRPLIPLFAEQPSSPQRLAVIAAMNGVMGDYLLATANPLAIAMHLSAEGRTLVLDAPALAEALPGACGKVVLLVHGLCMNDAGWKRNGHDHGEVLARELGATAIYLHYNTGLHISTNGAQLAALLEAVSAAWPVPIAELTIVGHSMGGLVARSAVRAAECAGHHWRARLKALVFLGTPHFGSPVERGGSRIDGVLAISPYIAPFAKLGRIRSAGITDLRHGNLTDADWQHADRFARGPRRPVAVPLPDGVACFAIAATTGARSGDRKDRLLGDGLVPVASALGRHRLPSASLAIPPERQRIVTHTDHMELLSSEAVCEQLVQWLRN
ncbi:MAG TPA: hypothetical protein VFV17_02490 [Usitatibacteraceae bacterium]|nr:hypothetical protein [Usitatibacteraceae bacterium]